MRHVPQTKTSPQLTAEEKLLTLLDAFCRHHVDTALSQGIDDVLQQFDELLQTHSNDN